MSMIRIKFGNDEFVDFPDNQTTVRDWVNTLARPDEVVTITGGPGEENEGHTLYVPVRAIAAVEVYPEDVAS